MIFSLIPEVTPIGREQNVLKIVFVNYGNSLIILDIHHQILRPHEPLNTFYSSCSSLQDMAKQVTQSNYGFREWA